MGFMKSGTTDVTCPGKVSDWVDYNGATINSGESLPIAVTECPPDDEEGVLSWVSRIIKKESFRFHRGNCRK